MWYKVHAGKVHPSAYWIGLTLRTLKNLLGIFYTVVPTVPECVKMSSKVDFSQTLRSLNLINIIFNLKKGTGCSCVFSIIWQRYTNSGCIKFRNVVISDILDATDVIILFQLPVGQITVLWITPIICCLLRLRLLRTGAQKYSTWRMNGGMLTVLRKIISYAQCPQCTQVSACTMQRKCKLWSKRNQVWDFVYQTCGKVIRDISQCLGVSYVIIVAEW